MISFKPHTHKLLTAERYACFVVVLRDRPTSYLVCAGINRNASVIPAGNKLQQQNRMPGEEQQAKSNCVYNTITRHGRHITAVVIYSRLLFLFLFCHCSLKAKARDALTQPTVIYIYHSCCPHQPYTDLKGRKEETKLILWKFKSFSIHFPLHWICSLFVETNAKGRSSKLSQGSTDRI